MDIWQQQEQAAKEAREARTAKKTKAKTPSHIATDIPTRWFMKWWVIALSGFIVLNFGYALAMSGNEIGLMLLGTGLLTFIIGVLSGMVIAIRDAKTRKTPILPIVIAAIMLSWYFIFREHSGLLGASTALFGLPGLFMFFYSVYDVSRFIYKSMASHK